MLLLAPGLLLGALLAGCGGDGGVLRYDELVAAPVADSPTPHVEIVPNGVPCAERVRWSRRLRDGQALELEVDLGREPRLVVVFCRPRKGEGELRLRVADATGDPAAPRVEQSVEIADWPAWKRWQADLTAAAGRRVQLRLEASLPPGIGVLIADAYVEHRGDRAAAWTGAAVRVEGEEVRERRKQGRNGDATPEDGPTAAAAAPGEDADAGSPAPPTPAADANATPAAAPSPALPASDLAGRQILLVSVDTLRWDALHTRLADGSPLMPHLARLAAEGEVFDPHHAGAAWTKPSHATLLTGYPLSVHGADGDEGSLDPAVPTLAERFSRAGMATGAVVHDCVWLNPKFGLHRGFGQYRSTKGGAAPSVRRAVNWIAEHRDRPFFFFFHTFDVHSDFHRLPYEADAANSAGVEALFGVRGYGCRRGQCASGLLAAIRRGLPTLPGEGEVLRHLYGAGAREADAELGRLFDALQELGVWDDLTLVVTSDHGEMMLEHGDTLHGLTWEEVLRVPLVVKWPRGERAGRRTAVPTASLDVAPTLLALAGVDAPGLPGVDLRRPRADRPVFVGSITWWTVYEDGWKGIFFNQGGRRHLYHLDRDPGELRDLSRRRPEVAARLQERIGEMLAWSEATRRRLSAGAATSGGESALTPEERDRLRALGYLQ